MHYMYVDILFPLWKAIPILFEHFITHCHNLNVLPHALLHALLKISSQFIKVWGYFQRVTTHYHQIYKKYIYINIFSKVDGNAWQPIANSPKAGKSQKKCMVTCVVASVVTCSVRFHKPSHLLLPNLFNMLGIMSRYCF